MNASVPAQLGLGPVLDGRGRAQPSVEVGQARPDDPARHRHGMVRPLGRDEGKPAHAIPRAKKAAASLRIRFSSSSRLFSRLRRCISACSALRAASGNRSPQSADAAWPYAASPATAVFRCRRCASTARRRTPRPARSTGRARAAKPRDPEWRSAGRRRHMCRSFGSGRPVRRPALLREYLPWGAISTNPAYSTPRERGQDLPLADIGLARLGRTPARSWRSPDESDRPALATGILSRRWRTGGGGWLTMPCRRPTRPSAGPRC